MVTVDLNKLELNEFIAKSNPGQRCKATFPMLGMMGTKNSAMVLVELAPGEELGTHTDSAEEILLVLEGKIEATVEKEKVEATKDELILVPKMIPHNFKNTGNTTARVLGFFGGANNIVATFENVWSPTESNTVDTSLINA